ncbi:hypothetical protein VQH23_04850 [Pararoseomonas sp. SCSIO 73927]|uniref:hypothetical protein n=1 Tax=Pararoseomonas sp. SCSIO 73927 TaxID=3114537 RepID=UPI0030D4D377
MKAVSPIAGPELLPDPEGQDWVGLLLDAGLVEAALDGLGSDGVRVDARPILLPAPLQAPSGAPFRLAGFRGAGAGGGGPGSCGWAGMGGR